MGKRGPQPKPAAIKRLEGNPGKRKMPVDSLKASGQAERPEHVTGYAAEVWQNVINSMPPGLYTAADAQLLAAYSMAAQIAKYASERLQGALDDDYRKWAAIYAKYAQLLATLGTRLGLDPTARNNLSLPTTQETSKFKGLIGINGGKDFGSLVS